jgi:hypothetical protein
VDPIIEKIVITIVGIVVSGLATWLGAQIIKYKKLIKKEEDETVKNTIKSALTDELAPIRTDIGKMKTDISSL